MSSRSSAESKKPCATEKHLSVKCLLDSQIAGAKYDQAQTACATLAHNYRQCIKESKNKKKVKIDFSKI
jgi:hypothetical protein